MPRPGPARKIIAMRLSDGGISWIDERAKKEGVNRSEMIRIMIKFASSKMPEGYR